jgi:hypothetical protein
MMKSSARTMPGGNVEWSSYLRTVVSQAAGAAAAAAAVPGGPVAAASAKAAAEKVSDALLAQFLGAHEEQMERMDALAQEMRGRLTELQDAVGSLLDRPWRKALEHIDEAAYRPRARERELELARSELFEAWAGAKALLDRNPRSADPAALRCPVIAQQIAAVYGFLGEPQNMRRWLVKGYLASLAQLGNQVDGLHDLLVEKVKREKVKRRKSPLDEARSMLRVELCSSRLDSDDLLWRIMPGEVFRPGRYERKVWYKLHFIARDPDFEGKVAGLATMDAESQLLRLTCITAGADDPVLEPAAGGGRRALRYKDATKVVFSWMTVASITARGKGTSVLNKAIDSRYSDILPIEGFIWA